MAEESVKGESGYYVFRPEERIYRETGCIRRVCIGIPVCDYCVLEYKSGEGLQVYLFKSDFSVKSLRKDIHDLRGYERLHLRELNGQYPRKDEGCRCHNSQPDYFDGPFDDCSLYVSPTCKNSKNIG